MTTRPNQSSGIFLTYNHLLDIYNYNGLSYHKEIQMTNAALKLSEHDDNYFKYSEDITNLPFINNWILSWGIKVGKKYQVLIRNKNGFKNVLYTNSAELVSINKVLLLFNHTYLNEKKFIGLNILAQLKDKHYFDADVYIMFDKTMSSLMSDKDFTVDYFYIG
jgi:hypothetical protein